MVAPLTFPYIPTTELLHKWGGVITKVHGIVVMLERPRGGRSRDLWWFDCDVRWTDGSPPGRCPVEPFKLAAEQGGENSDIRALCTAMNDYLAAHGKWYESGPHRGWYAHRARSSPKDIKS